VGYSTVERGEAVARVLEAQRAVERAEQEADAARARRRQAVADARAVGVTWAELGRALGVSRQRAAQLLDER
jgi:hypothetical protein